MVNKKLTLSQKQLISLMAQTIKETLLREQDYKKTKRIPALSKGQSSASGNYYYRTSSKKKDVKGPFSQKEFRDLWKSGEIKPNHMIWHPNFKNTLANIWRPAGSFNLDLTPQQVIDQYFKEYPDYVDSEKKEKKYDDWVEYIKGSIESVRRFHLPPTGKELKNVALVFTDSLYEKQKELQNQMTTDLEKIQVWDDSWGDIDDSTANPPSKGDRWIFDPTTLQWEFRYDTIILDPVIVSALDSDARKLLSDEFAQKKYQKNFEELSDDEKDVVDDLISDEDLEQVKDELRKSGDYEGSNLDDESYVLPPNWDTSRQLRTVTSTWPRIASNASSSTKDGELVKRCAPHGENYRMWKWERKLDQSNNQYYYTREASPMTLANTYFDKFEGSNTPINTVLFCPKLMCRGKVAAGGSPVGVISGGKYNDATLDDWLLDLTKNACRKFTRSSNNIGGLNYYPPLMEETEKRIKTFQNKAQKERDRAEELRSDGQLDKVTQTVEMAMAYENMASLYRQLYTTWTRGSQYHQLCDPCWNEEFRAIPARALKALGDTMYEVIQYCGKSLENGLYCAQIVAEVTGAVIALAGGGWIPVLVAGGVALALAGARWGLGDEGAATDFWLIFAFELLPVARIGWRLVRFAKNVDVKIVQNIMEAAMKKGGIPQMRRIYNTADNTTKGALDDFIRNLDEIEADVLKTFKENKKAIKAMSRMTEEELKYLPMFSNVPASQVRQFKEMLDGGLNSMPEIKNLFNKWRRFGKEIGILTVTLSAAGALILTQNDELRKNLKQILKIKLIQWGWMEDDGVMEEIKNTPAYKEAVKDNTGKFNQELANKLDKIVKDKLEEISKLDTENMSDSEIEKVIEELPEPIKEVLNNATDEIMGNSEHEYWWVEMFELLKEGCNPKFNEEAVENVVKRLNDMIAEEDIEGAGEYMTIIFNRVWSLECTCKLTPNLEGC